MLKVSNVLKIEWYNSCIIVELIYVHIFEKGLIHTYT